MTSKSLTITHEAHDSHSGQISIEGSIQLEHLEEIAEAFKTSSIKHQSLIIDLINAKEINTGFLQLLAAFIKSRSEQGLLTDYNFDTEDDMLELMDNTGLLDMIADLN